MTTKIKVKKIDKSVLTAHLTKLKLSTEGSPKEQAIRLEEYEAKKHKRMDLLKCEECAGVSNKDLDECPFCGDKEETETGADPKPIKASQARATAKSKAKAKDGPVANKDKPKASKPTMPEEPKEQETVSSEVVPAKVVALSDMETDLNRSLKRLEDYQSNTLGAFWDMGVVLNHMFQNELYRARTDADGNPTYKHWNHFCKAETSFTSGYCYTLMDIAANTRREDVAALGVSKAKTLLKLPPTLRNELADRAKKEGLTVSKIGKEVAQLAAGSAPRATNFKGGAAGLEKAIDVNISKTESAVIGQLGRLKIPLYAKPKNKGDEPKRAMSVQALPHGEEDVLNDIRVTYRLVKETKGLVLIIERVRV